jgi:TP901 family phage tail tape measure protein
MADRVVKVTIQASIANYVSGMEKVRKATADAAKESEKLEKFGQAATSVGTALLGVGAVAVGAAAVVVKMAADFDAQMSKVQAATGATSAEMAKFREQALTAGAQFGYTATQVTEAQVELGKAGVSTSDIMSGLSGVLGLAASDNLDLGQATQIASVAMTQFGKAGADIPHIADLLAAGAGKALGGVDQLGQALNQSGQVANQFGLSIEDTVGTLSAFAGAGLLGSDAGTSFKTMLQSLANPAKQTKDLMKQLGLNFYDANGQFIGITGAAQELQDKLGTLTDQQRQAALAQIFGSDAVRAASVLYKEGASGIQEWINKVDDSGYAQEQARIKSDNLTGDLKKLQSAFQSGLIESGAAADGALRPLVQTMTQVVTAFNGLPEPVKGSALALTAVVGGASLLAGGLLVAIPKIVEFRAALATLAAGGVTSRAALGSVASFLGGPWGAALAFAALAVTAFVGPQLEAAKRTKEFVNTLDSVTGAVTKTTSALVASNLATKGTFLGIDVGPSTFDQAKKAGLSLQTIQKAAEGNTKAYKELKSAVSELDDARGVGNVSENRAANAADSVLKSVEEQRSALKSAKDQTTQMAQAQDASADASGNAAAGLDDVADSAEDATQAISDTANAIKNFGSAQFDVDSATRSLEQAVDDFNSKLKETKPALDAAGSGFNVAEQSGRDAQAAIEDIAKSTLDLASATYTQTGSQEKATAVLEDGRKKFIDAATAAGISKDAANKYADSLGLIPGNVSTVVTNTAAAAGDTAAQYKQKLDALPAAKRTQINAATASAKSALQGVLDTVNSLPSSKTVTITTITNQVTNAAQSVVDSLTKNKADGGYISGPGTGTSDSIPAMLSNGEYVVKASSVAKYGTGFLDRVNAGRYANGGHVRKYAGGGAVQFEYSRRNGDYSGLSGVSQLMSIANDSSYKARWRNDVGMAALRFQSSLSKLTDQSSAAASKLSDLRSSADSLKSSVASAVGKFDVGDYRSASSLKRGLSKSAANVTEFANLLTTLSKKGISGDLLAEIASLGTAEGLPLARSLAAASASDIKSINASYASIQSTATKAGQTVADANYKSLIAAADKNAKSLEAQIAKQSKAIQTIIGRSFGLKGFASGGYTGAYGTGQVAGVVHGREFVMNAAATARNRAVLEAMNQGGNVRYMDPTPVAAAAAPAQVIHRAGNNYNLSVQDPTAVAQAIERRERSEYA